MSKTVGLKKKLAMALLPTATVLVVLAMVEVLSRQRLLFASLASSAFLIYLDPEHETNKISTLVLAQMGAACLGLLAYLILGAGYISAGTAMVATIVVMILFNVVHPPAVSTALSFALRAGDEKNIVLFGLAVGITALLVVLQKSAVWIARRHV